MVVQRLDFKEMGKTIENGDFSPEITDFTHFSDGNHCSPSSVTRTFTLQNLSTISDLNLIGTPPVRIASASAPDFTVTAQPTTSNLTTGGTSSTSFEITYTPNLPGIQWAIIEIPSNDPLVGTFQFLVHGSGGVSPFFENEGQKIIDNLAATGDHYLGEGIAVHGNFAVIGGYGDNHSGTDAGSAYVYENVAGIWTRIARLRASDAATSDNFGRAVGIHGDYIIVSSDKENPGGKTDAGSAYIFEKPLTGWVDMTETAKNYSLGCC